MILFFNTESYLSKERRGGVSHGMYPRHEVAEENHDRIEAEEKTALWEHNISLDKAGKTKWARGME